MTLYAVCLTQTPLHIDRMSDFQRVIHFANAQTSHEAIGLVMEKLSQAHNAQTYYTYSAVVALELLPVSVDGPTLWVMSRIGFAHTPQGHRMNMIQCVEFGTERSVRDLMEQHSTDPHTQFSNVAAATPSLEIIKGCAV